MSLCFSQWLQNVGLVPADGDNVHETVVYLTNPVRYIWKDFECRTTADYHSQMETIKTSTQIERQYIPFSS